ncbi:hypothetical protein SSX86_013047 [Deinandra increscens subsp. villosa]|uniref:Cation-transporting P-type ATPase C-terminal domain-containing protein n=1 Tax=Deinandra increscens subsp. villosa TaxID=3103831 RepID=A0AAP0D6X6_9ASTR
MLVLKQELTDASDGLATSSENHRTINQLRCSQTKNISRIVRQKNFATLQEFHGVVGVADALGTDLEKGVSEDVLHLKQELTRNLAPTRSFFHLVWEEVKKKTVLFYFVVAVLSIVFESKEKGLENGWIDGVAMLVAIVLQVLFTSIRIYWKEQMARKKLQEQQSVEGGVKEICVIRGGESNDICESELVCGDLVLLKIGCQVPADGLFVDGEDLELDYGSELYTVNAQKPFLSYGGRVINGNARMIVTSENMMMRKATCDPNTRSELETHLHKLNTCMHYIRILVGFLIVIVLFLRYEAGKIDDENVNRQRLVAEPIKIVMKILSVSLVALTEGVAFVVTLAILYRNHQMLSAKAPEQDPFCISKMAAVTKICTDMFGEFTEEATQAEVKACRECGIEIIIASSEKLTVLKDNALQHGLITSDDPQSLLLRGEDFRKYTDKERLQNINKIRVLGEAFSSDKLLLVETLRENGDVVVFLGQRTDEAPALMGADIGIAMGRRSFSEIISLVYAGKSFQLNIQSFLQPVLILTISGSLITFIQTALWGDASLTIVQSLWVNFAVLFLGGLALLTNTSPEKPVSLVPKPCKRSLVNAQMITNILVQVSYQVTSLMVIQTKGSGVVGSNQCMKTVISNIFVICQFFNLFNARELQKKNFFRFIHRQKEFWLAITAFIVLHVSFVVVQDIFGHGAKLNWKLWAGCVLVGLFSWLIDWLGKCISWFIINNFVNRFCST